MSWRKGISRVLIAATGAAALAGCGFQPLHSRGAGGSAARLAEIRIMPITDRIGQQLHNLLLDKLTPMGPPAAARYVLRVTVGESLQSLAVRKDEVATRANLLMRAKFTLTRADDGSDVFSANAISVNSYNILRQKFASLSAENDARARAVREISDEIRTRIAIYLSIVR